jgi:hypothetical protein
MCVCEWVVVVVVGGTFVVIFVHKKKVGKVLKEAAHGPCGVPEAGRRSVGCLEEPAEVREKREAHAFAVDMAVFHCMEQAGGGAMERNAGQVCGGEWLCATVESRLGEGVTEGTKCGSGVWRWGKWLDAQRSRKRAVNMMK